MEGFGKYTLPTGTYYEGEMYDGMFHGKGTLHFQNGSKYHATWERGHPKNVLTAEHAPDQSRSQLVDKEPRKQIPPGCYDTGDGFYDPLTRVVTDYTGRFLRNSGRSLALLNNTLDAEEHIWITTKCRKAWDEHVGATYDAEVVSHTSKPY
ncbi:unnamed protein product [Trichobilharzia regenti]|nr:unnamed protein product [Trichobilharzia regenti]